MHELAVTESILDIAIRYGEEARATKITDIRLVIGKFSSIVDDSVQFYWDTIARGTIAEGAKLHFDRKPAIMTCLDCGEKFEPSDETFACPKCLSVRIKLTQGDELQLESIDVETGENPESDR